MLTDQIGFIAAVGTTTSHMRLHRWMRPPKGRTSCMAKCHEELHFEKDSSAQCAFVAKEQLDTLSMEHDESCLREPFNPMLKYQTLSLPLTVLTCSASNSSSLCAVQLI